MADFDLISKQRKVSNIKGTGLQYLPGHKDKYIDLCTRIITRDKKSKLKILDIGGGGLRFVSSILTLNNVKKIYIVEPDYYALDYKKIFDIAKMNTREFRLFEKKCVLMVCDINDFLQSIDKNIVFDYICAFRVFHFFSAAQFNKIIRRLVPALKVNGKFFISNISFYDNKAKGKYNILFKNSTPIEGNRNYRKFNTKKFNLLYEIDRQNLPMKMLFFDLSYLDRNLNKYGLFRQGLEHISTRLVNGYVYIKRVFK